jgi:hypothetical protein
LVGGTGDRRDMNIEDQPFVGSEALRAGIVRQYELRTKFVPLFPDVYLRRGVEPTIERRAHAAWLWSYREGVLAGLTAAALHGAKWVDPSLPVEIIWPNARRPKGVRTFDYRLCSDEFVDLGGGFRITTPARTAFDLGRRRGRVDAVARLDALSRASGIGAEQVAAVARRHRGARGIRWLEERLGVVDAGAQSPKETWLRLLLMDNGFPRPHTQIPIVGPGGHSLYYLDMGWEAEMVAVEYDGDDHREQSRWRNDIVRSEFIAHLGWRLVRVVAGDREADIVARVRRAWASRLL